MREVSWQMTKKREMTGTLKEEIEEMESLYKGGCVLEVDACGRWLRAGGGSLRYMVSSCWRSWVDSIDGNGLTVRPLWPLFAMSQPPIPPSLTEFQIDKSVMKQVRQWVSTATWLELPSSIPDPVPDPPQPWHKTHLEPESIPLGRRASICTSADVETQKAVLWEQMAPIAMERFDFVSIIPILKMRNNEGPAGSSRS
ncbi:hypothetical protein E6O75_ATG08262 [Venturia nashicola]|uniref:Uncharacterized protein n=1 Tax=Venturia nashicola TaxID=86259 RepID=A0A4Z1NP71_9PEZI|nr:hypothetical protein E6O75_ATG08262 [Venturia nashicola]